MTVSAKQLRDIRSALRFAHDAPTGNVWFVHATNGTAGGGYTADGPITTIDGAINLAAAGDTIYVLPGHAETITGAAAIDADVAGISIIGLGTGTRRPTITYGTNTTATTEIAAANVTIKNLRFLSNVDSLAVFLTVAENDATIEDCDFIGASTKEVLNAIGITTTYDNTVIRGCKFIQATDPAGTSGNAGTGAIYLVDSENVLIENCEFRGCWETAFVHNKTTAALNLWIRNCYGYGSTLTADAVPFVLVAGATGAAERCSFVNPNEAALTEATFSGTFGAGFWNFGTLFGNDGGMGQLGAASQAAAG